MTLRCLLVALFLSSVTSALYQKQVHEVFSWTQIEYAFPSTQARQSALWNGIYDPNVVVPIGVAAAGHRVFVSTPRWKSGVPVSLSTIPVASNSSSPLLEPYPSWAWHRQGACDSTIVSVFRVKVDECNRLWVLDTGAVNTFVHAEHLCPPRVIVFDLTTDKVIFTYEFPSDVLKHESLLVTLEVEYAKEHCGGSSGAAGAIIYAADTTEFGLIVADLRLRGAESAWRIQDKTMYPSPDAGTFTVNKESFELMDGILGLALSPRNFKGDRILYYHSMSGFKQHWVRTSVLHNSTLAADSPQLFQSSVYPRSSQSAGVGIDHNGVMFFGLLASNSLSCWNTRKPFLPHNIVTLSQDDKALQFVTSTSVDREGRVWAVSTRLQKFILETLNPKEINYRIVMAGSSSVLVKGTACERHVTHHVHIHHHHVSDNHLP